MSDDLIQRVLKSIATSKRIPLETVTIDSTFEQLNIDSMDAVEILFALENEFDIDLMGTESFITWMHQKFKVPNSENAWAAIKIAAGGNVPEPREDDPIHIRK